MFDLTRTVDLTDLTAFFALAGGISATLWLFTLAALTIAQALPMKPDASDWFASMSSRLRQLATPDRLTPETTRTVDEFHTLAFGIWAMRKIAPVAMLFQAAMLLSLVCLYPHPFQGLIAFVPATSIFIFGRIIRKLNHRHAEIISSEKQNEGGGAPFITKIRLNILTLFPEWLIGIGVIALLVYATPWLSALIVGLEIAFGMLYASDALVDLI